MENHLNCKDIGRKIKMIRGHLSQAEFAEKVGIHHSLIASYESAERLPAPVLLEKFARYGKVSIDSLLGIDDILSHKLRREGESLLYHLRKLSARDKPTSSNIFMHLLLIIGLILWFKYLGIW